MPLVNVIMVTIGAKHVPLRITVYLAIEFKFTIQAILSPKKEPHILDVAKDRANVENFTVEKTTFFLTSLKVKLVPLFTY